MHYQVRTRDAQIPSQIFTAASASTVAWNNELLPLPGYISFSLFTVDPVLTLEVVPSETQDAQLGKLSDRCGDGAC